MARRKPKQLGLFDAPEAPPLVGAGEPHEWMQWTGRDWKVCRKCGVLWRRENRPCLGIVGVTVQMGRAR